MKGELVENQQCEWCGDPVAENVIGGCQRCLKIWDKRPEIAAAIVAGYFNGYMSVSDEQVKRAAEMADVLVKELCRRKP